MHSSRAQLLSEINCVVSAIHSLDNIPYPKIPGGPLLLFYGQQLHPMCARNTNSEYAQITKNTMTDGDCLPQPSQLVPGTVSILIEQEVAPGTL